MRQLVKNSKPTIFDVGAHTGNTVKRFRSLFPGAKIFCFEPFPAAFARLSASVTGDPMAESYRVAIADVSGVSNLAVNQNTATNSLLASDARAANYWGPKRLDTRAVIEVNTETIEHFCDSKGLKHLDILKLDVQGAEYAVLEGARGLLQQQRIDLIYMEVIMAPTYVGQRKLAEYLALFQDLHYELFNLYNPRHKNGRLIQTDNIFISSEFLSRYEQSHGATAT